MTEEATQLKTSYESQKMHYIHLNNLEGDLHGRIADLRGSTTKQLTQNKDVERRISNETSTKNQLLAEIAAVEAETRRVHQQT